MNPGPSSLSLMNVGAKRPKNIKCKSVKKEENSDDYQPGGYYPTKIGELLATRYVVCRKLGWGHYSTVWLCWDLVDKGFVAIKIIKSSPMYFKNAYKEIRLLKSIDVKNDSNVKCDKIVKYLDCFLIRGMCGLHMCIVLEVLGPNISNVMKQSKHCGLGLILVKKIIKQVLEGLEFLHSKCRLIHSDIKPSNVLLYGNDFEIRKMGCEALELYLGGSEFPPSFITSAPQHFEKFATITQPRAKLECLRTQIKKMNKFMTQGERDQILQMVHDLSHPEESKTNNKKTCVESDVPGTKDGNDIEKNLAASSERKKLSSYAPKPLLLLPEIASDRKHLSSDSNIYVKIGDLGNACFDDSVSVIQTRPYRSLEVLIWAGYHTSADIWSVACMAFELATGKKLFDPCRGQGYSATDDHLGQIVSLLGPIPMNILDSGIKTMLYFNSEGGLKHITRPESQSLFNLLVEKYKWSIEDANEFAGFLLPMLNVDKNSRATASECIQHPWLQF